jgi:hypothetical protein
LPIFDHVIDNIEPRFGEQCLILGEIQAGVVERIPAIAADCFAISRKQCDAKYS